MLDFYHKIGSNLKSCFSTGILERGLSIDGLGQKCFLTYESNVLFALRFMVDCDIVGGNWIELKAGLYYDTERKLSHCQLEVDLLYPCLLSHLLHPSSLFISV